MGVKENLELMKTLDDAWNAGPKGPLWETFKKRHREDVKVYWPAQPLPTIGRHSHDVEATEFFKTFDNKLVNNPYKIAFGDGARAVRRASGSRRFLLFVVLIHLTSSGYSCSFSS